MKTSIFAIQRTPRAIRGLVALLFIALSATVLTVAPGGQTLAHADSAPDAGTPATVTSDALPTAQIGNGVVWNQAVAGTTVFVGGDFTTARPAGTALGAPETVTRTYLMAYDITTGVMTSFAPTLNGQVYSVAVSPDGSTLYAGGQFTTVNGQTRNRIAAFDVATGNLLPFNPNANGIVYGISVTSTTVWFGGVFTNVGGVARAGGAAISLATGLLTSWAPVQAGGNIRELVVSPDGTKVALGGNFTSMNGNSTYGYGLAIVDGTLGTTNVPMPISSVIRDAGTNAAILSLALSADGNSIYGSGYSYQKVSGNMEGSFKFDWNGNIIWIEDCHGDTYSVFPQGDVVYVTGHAHFCGNVAGFPQTSPTWTYQRAMAFTDAVGGTIEKEQYGYYNYEGQPRPTLLSWFPDFTVGTYTGQSQAAWSVAGNSDYVVFGGEFPSVDGKAQQGLVRFAKTTLTGSNNPGLNTDGPRLQSADFVPTLTSVAEGVRISWPANYDRDNETLTYAILKNGNTTTPIWTSTVKSTFWQRPRMSYIDRNVTSGTAVSYRLQVTDAKGNQRRGDPVSITPSGGLVLSAYDKMIMGDSPQYYWRLNEAAGATTAVDINNGENGTIGAQVTPGTPGAIPGDGTAFHYSGTDNTSTVSTQTLRAPSYTFTAEAWFRSTTTKGGKIIGWGTKSSGDSSSSDKMVYLGRTGKLYFGVYPLAYKTVSSTQTYNDGNWHLVDASLSKDGMKLYVDGVLVGSQANVTQPALSNGYWRVGGDFMYGWPDNPVSTSYFTGDIDNAAIYNYPLTLAQVAAHKNFPTNAAPTASFTANQTNLTASVNASASTDSDGVVAGYAWDYGDGTTGTGVTATHDYAAPGTYTITLTVTDENGAPTSTTQQVTAVSVNVLPTASFTFSGQDLTWAFDGTGSTDSDGTIASYAWNFGDGSTDTTSGATVSHTYLNPGTYTVSLTVTDDRGGTNTATQQVTATAPQNYPFVSDTFDRTLASGLGSAPIGGAWTVSTASGFSVGSGVGVWKLNSSGVTRTAYLNSAPSNNTDLTMNLSVDGIPNSGGLYLTVLGRRISSTLDYRTNVKLTTGAKLQVSLAALQGSSTQTSLTSTTTLTPTIVPGDVIHIRMQTFGTNSTTIRSKVWVNNDAEPGTWTVSATDSYAGLQTTGAVGLTAYTSATNVPINVNVADITARAAQ